MYSLFVTITAWEERTIANTTEAIAETEKIYVAKGVSTPNSISDDLHHHEPQLAKSHAVVERVIGSLKG